MCWARWSRRLRRSRHEKSAENERLSPAELTHILDVADQLKAQQKLGGTAPLLAGKTVALIFSKASTNPHQL